MAKKKDESNTAVDRLIASAFEGRELVFCADGPRAGAWYFRDWWKEQRLSAERTQRILTAALASDEPVEQVLEQLAGCSVLAYVPTKDGQPHPKNPGVVGQVLRWVPEASS